MESLVCICGAGTMGRGIALAAASQGISVILYDLNPETIHSATSAIKKELELLTGKKQTPAEEKENILRRITFTSLISDCRAPLIIEAILEKTEAKSALFLELARINNDETLFVTNTSSLSVTRIAGQTPFPERIAGLHFFNPANRMKLVEIIRTKYISEYVLQRIIAFAGQLGKTAVVCRDAPGFIVNHVARPFYLEALRLAETGTADRTTIDKLMESAGFKMGPFHLMDLIGNDINYTVSCSLYEALGRPDRLKPSALQEAMVQRGELGKKTGSGFFQYTKPVSE
ncbi:MAG TPA: 3-hydroxybutyryl-CoA dehydrogenase [Chitinophagaceae bacterium]|nr:3-hydroxybutyryl-CoA dehydrogenase [Chitinophagaceae bacterium]